MLHAPMYGFLRALLILALGLAASSVALSQEIFSGVDLLYPELAHPQSDAEHAITQRDFRFVAIDRFGKDAPGVERHPRLKQKYGTKLVRQPFRIFATKSQDFSFALRARAYATDYNGVLLHYLLRASRPK